MVAQNLRAKSNNNLIKNKITSSDMKMIKTNLIILLTISIITLASISAVYAQTYQEVTTITGSSDQTTNYFNIPNKEARYQWSYSSTSDYAAFYIALYKEGSDIAENLLTTATDQTSGTEYLHNLTPGNYYIKIGAANLNSYTITIESQQSTSNTATPKPTNNGTNSSEPSSAVGLVIVGLIVIVVLGVVLVKFRSKKANKS
jgi:heme/copper-type cytochrome/quinol oxidase subunit 2